MREVVFDSDAVRVVKVEGAPQHEATGDSARDNVVFVTFESYADERGADRAGFGEHFLQSRGFTAYHFLPRSNVWYQYPEMEAALASVRADIAPGKRILTYGMSMGGYAAFRFADRLGAHCVVAFSPQYSIDPRIVKWEKRWHKGMADVPPLLWESGVPRRDVPLYVFYDPHDHDRRHVRLIAREHDVRRVRIRYGSHPCIGYLNECGLLGDVIIALAEDRFDAAACQREAWARREQSTTYQMHPSRMKRSTPLRVFRKYLMGRFG